MSFTKRRVSNKAKSHKITPNYGHLSIIKLQWNKGSDKPNTKKNRNCKDEVSQKVACMYVRRSKQKHDVRK